MVHSFSLLVLAEQCAMTKGYWQNQLTKVGDLVVGLGVFTQRMVADETPSWAALQKAPLWKAKRHADLRQFLLDPKPKIEKVQTGEADVLASRTTVWENGKELKRALSIFNGATEVVPHGVLGMQYSFGIAEATPAGAPMRPLLRHLLVQEVPVMIWGPPNLVRHKSSVVERDYPMLRRQFISWLILPLPHSRLPIESGKQASERLILLITQSFQPIQKV